MVTVFVIECGNCGSKNCYEVDSPDDYEVYTECFDCGEEFCDNYADLYGCMSVPWGFLL